MIPPLSKLTWDVKHVNISKLWVFFCYENRPTGKTHLNGALSKFGGTLIRWHACFVKQWKSSMQHTRHSCLHVKKWRDNLPVFFLVMLVRRRIPYVNLWTGSGFHSYLIQGVPSISSLLVWVCIFPYLRLITTLHASSAFHNCFLCMAFQTKKSAYFLACGLGGWLDTRLHVWSRLHWGMWRIG